MKKIFTKKYINYRKRYVFVEEKISKNYEDYQMRCPTHLSIGQEAIAAASGLALNKKDISISYHRSHAHYLAKVEVPKNYLQNFMVLKKGVAKV